ncbi:hypothetical protein Tco_1053186 [Tanacetum coccineum]
MQRYNPFRRTCGKGNIILRTSCQPDTFGLQYYACPRSKPGTKNYGCGYFDWKDAFDERLMVSSSSTSEGSSGPYKSEQPQPSYSSGPHRFVQTQPSYSSGPCRSEPIECSNCKVKDLTINRLESRNRTSQSAQTLGAQIAYQKYACFCFKSLMLSQVGGVIIKDKTVDSAALFHDLYNDMENLGLE